MQRSWRPTRRRSQFHLRSWLGERLSSRLRLTGAAAGLLFVSSGLTLSALAAASATPPLLALSSTSTGVTCPGATVFSTDPVCTGVSAGVTIALSGQNFAPGALASIEECSDDPSQPIIYYLGTSIPISCTPLAITTVPSTGNLSGSKVVKGGTLAAPAATGPPVAGTPSCTATQLNNGTTTTSSIPNCTTSGSGATDAAKFPCPPTAAQIAAGDTCIFAIGDNAGDHAVGLILWTGETVPTVTTSTASQASGQISDQATVNSGNIYAGSPSGSVSFYVCQTGTTSTLTPGTCATTGTPESTETLTANSDNETSQATSSGFTPTSNGTWCFSVSYPGASYYAGSVDNVNTTDHNECVLVSGSSGTTTTSSSSTTTSTSSTTTTTHPTTTTTSSTTTTTQPTTTTLATTTTTTQPTTTTTASTTTTTSGTVGLTGPYELFCPGTPVGDVVLNDVTTTATVSPSSVPSGGSFALDGYQTKVNIPNSLATAASALQPDLTGSATTQIDATGATPATTPEGPFTFDVPIPNPVPTNGVELDLPSTPITVTGFKLTGSSATIQQDSSASLTLTVAGTDLQLTCTSYPNDTVTPSGITSTPPGSSPIAPVIAVVSGGTTGTTTTTTGPTTTTTVGTGCKPGWGNGDKNHCHSGPPGQDGGGPPQSAGGPPGGHLNPNGEASYRSSAWEGPVGPTLTLLGTVLLLLITLPRRRPAPGTGLSRASMARRRDWLLGR